MTIDFISAKDGGLAMYEGYDPGRHFVPPEEKLLAGWANTVDGVADILLDKGIAASVMGSSSMNFASEDGFDTDDGAMHLWKRALERAGI